MTIHCSFYAQKCTEKGHRRNSSGGGQLEFLCTGLGCIIRVAIHGEPLAAPELGGIQHRADGDGGYGQDDKGNLGGKSEETIEHIDRSANHIIRACPIWVSMLIVVSLGCNHTVFTDGHDTMAIQDILTVAEVGVVKQNNVAF